MLKLTGETPLTSGRQIILCFLLVLASFPACDAWSSRMVEGQDALGRAVYGGLSLVFCFGGFSALLGGYSLYLYIRSRHELHVTHMALAILSITPFALVILGWLIMLISS